LPRHGLANFFHAVTDIDHRRLPGGIQKPPAGRIQNPTAIAADSDGIGLPKISRK
jgi:hypothetical protein